MTEILTFAAQGSLVYLLGVQTLNVVGKHYILAMLTSFVLAVCGYYANAAVAHAGFAGIGGSIWWSYCLAGVFAAPLAIYTHPKIVRLYNKWIK